MSYPRALTASLLSAAVSFCLVAASGCGTTAIGIDDCRDIEHARCEAAKSCGIVTDVEACQLYYRDHCLHGLPAKLEAGDSVSACVEVIQAAGQCAQGDPEISLADCDPRVTARRRDLSRACDVVAHPERAPECGFLTYVPADEGAGGAGGQSAEPETSDADGSSGSPDQGGAAAVE